MLIYHERPERIAHGRSFVKNDRSELLKSLFKKKRMTKERREQFALGHKKGKTVKNIQKIRIFRANRSFFASDSLESHANHSNRYILKSDDSDLLFCKEQRERIAHGRSLK